MATKTKKIKGLPAKSLGYFSAEALKVAGDELHKKIPIERLKEYFGVKDEDYGPSEE